MLSNTIWALRLAFFFFPYTYRPSYFCLLNLWMVILGLNSDSSHACVISRDFSLAEGYSFCLLCNCIFWFWILKEFLMQPLCSLPTLLSFSLHRHSLLLCLSYHPFWQLWAAHSSFILQILFPRDIHCSAPLGLLPLLFWSPLSSHLTFLQLWNAFTKQLLPIQSTDTFKFSRSLFFLGKSNRKYRFLHNCHLHSSKYNFCPQNVSRAEQSTLHTGVVLNG